MGFLRRILGGGTGGARDDDGGGEDAGDAGVDEAARDRELLREDAARLNDELLQRQLRYADRSWTPPRQGGPRRAGEGEGEDEA